MDRRRRNGDHATTARINPCSHSCILPTLLLVCLPYTPTFRFVLSRGVWFHSVPIRVVLLLTLHSNPVDTNGLWGSSVDRRPPWDRNYSVEPPTRIECVGVAPESSSCSPGVRFLVLTTLLPLQEKRITRIQNKRSAVDPKKNSPRPRHERRGSVVQIRDRHCGTAMCFRVSPGVVRCVSSLLLS